MKKFCIMAALLLAGLSVNAQHPIFSYFDKNHHGVVRDEIETTELGPDNETLVTVSHRSDDVVWSRVIYRIIDVRYKQNYQLYFPTNPNDAKYKSLFRLILDAVIDGLPVFRSDDAGIIKPDFTGVPRPIEDLIQEQLSTYDGEGGQFDLGSTDNLIRKEGDAYVFDDTQWETISKNQLKFMIQEVVFFDKHYSRLYSKILAIAPLNSDKTTPIEADEDTPVTADAIIGEMYNALMFWIPFDDLRPYLFKQQIIPDGNDNRRVTYDEFFAKKLYSSYIIGDNNMFDSMIGQYGKRAMTEKEVRAEQERIATELLNFEQDLWEY